MTHVFLEFIPSVVLSGKTTITLGTVKRISTPPRSRIAPGIKASGAVVNRVFTPAAIVALDRTLAVVADATAALVAAERTIVGWILAPGPMTTLCATDATTV